MSYLTMPQIRLEMPLALMKLVYGGWNMNAHSWLAVLTDPSHARHGEDNACIFDNHDLVDDEAICSVNVRDYDTGSFRPVIASGRMSVYGHTQSPVIAHWAFFVWNMWEIGKTRQHLMAVIVPGCRVPFGLDYAGGGAQQACSPSVPSFVAPRRQSRRQSRRCLELHL